MQKWIIFGVVTVIIVACAIIAFNVDIETEYTPEVEINESDMRKTMISLYFLNKETNELDKETRLIDSKELIKDPYSKMVKMLIEGPEDDKLESLISNDVEIKDMSLDGNVLTISFSSNFLQNLENDVKSDLVINSISKTLTQLKEIDSINVKIDGNE